jgi:hypothetical protein
MLKVFSRILAGLLFILLIVGFAYFIGLAFGALKMVVGG